MDAQPLHIVLHDTSSYIPFPNDTKRVSRSPDASTMISDSDRSVREVNDLVTVGQVADDLGLARYQSHHLLQFILCVIRDH